MAEFTFGAISVATKKTTLKKYEAVATNVLKLSSNPQIVFLVDQVYSESEIKDFCSFLNIYCKLSNNYTILYPLKYTIDSPSMLTENSDTPVKFYSENHISFETMKKYIPTGAVVITIGAALYALTESDDIHSWHMFDFIFNKTYFWNSNINAYVLPASSFTRIATKYLPIEDKTKLGDLASILKVIDTYETRYLAFQVETAFKLIKEGSYNFRSPWSDRVYPNRVRIKIESKADFTTMLEKYKESTHVALDIETSGLDFMKHRVGCVTLSFDGITGYFVPIQFFDVRKFSSFIKGKVIIGANLKFDLKFLWKIGLVNLVVNEDIVQLGHCLSEDRFNSLKTAAWNYTDMGGYDKPLDDYVKTHKVESYIDDIPEHILFPYSTDDAIATYRAFFEMKAQLQHIDTKFSPSIYPGARPTWWNLSDYYYKVMMPAVMAYTRAEYFGIYVNIDYLEENGKILSEKVSELERSIKDEYKNQTIDLASADQLGKWLKQLGWPSLGLNKNGVYSTGDECLERWKQMGYELAGKLQKLRSMYTIQNMFLGNKEEGSGYWSFVRYHSEDNSYRMHPNFNVMRTATGRSRTQDPNTQQIPAHGELAKLVKKIFSTPNDEEYFICTMDFASLQVRLVAAMSNDPLLNKIYKDPSMGSDVHSITGFNVFASGKEFNFVKIEDEYGNKFEFHENQVIKVIEQGCKDPVEKEAKYILETDSLYV